MSNPRRQYTYVPAERETVILLNEADMEEGFFRISTTCPRHAQRILKKLGGWKAKGVEFSSVETSDAGGALAMNLKIPLPYLAPKSFCLSSPGERQRAARSRGLLNRVRVPPAKNGTKDGQ